MAKEEVTSTVDENLLAETQAPHPSEWFDI